uniref:LAGLIDADG type 1 homing endonuclease n=1 Tax=Rhizopogon vinicolor TaxID=80600 RepID=A0A4Y5SHS8_9AGAM|nr:LAGLIDADG type 1 homing endonuclease [Rhizopogon vinicolor]QDA23228.1 LAGLIDADG type 1 homing endonuclease [Rhizopogon vinicolor]
MVSLLLIFIELVNLDKLSYYSDIVLLNLTRCEDILLLIKVNNCLSFDLNVRKKVIDLKIIRLNKIITQYFIIHQRLNVRYLISKFSMLNINKNSLSENKDIFYQWLVGFTDAEGTFSIDRQNNNWSLIFQIGQSNYNLRVLHFIKKQLGVGNIIVEKNNNLAQFRIRDRSVLELIIFPIFDKYPLLTSKYFYYIKFKKAHAILSDKSLTKPEKDILIFNLIKTNPPLDYISPAWSIINNIVSNYENASKIISKSWLVGFTEAEGSFYLVNKSKNRIVHAFEITQKLDKIVLIGIKHILHISTKVQFKNAGYFTIVTTNSRAIENIIQYYNNTMKGMKSVEYRIWARSYVKDKGNFISLNKIRNQIRIMKQVKYNLIDMKI